MMRVCFGLTEYNPPPLDFKFHGVWVEKCRLRWMSDRMLQVVGWDWMDRKSLGGAMPRAASILKKNP